MNRSGCRVLVAACWLVGLVALSANASAGSGWLAGQVQFLNKNGGYCPSTQDCNNATYPEWLWNVDVGIPDAQVRVRRTFDNTLLGATNTDSTGFYSMSWYGGPGSASENAFVEVVYRHKDGRFYFHNFGNTPHSNYTTSTPPFTLVHGTTEANPQWGYWYWGTSATPNDVANTYWAAWKLWDGALQFSTRMVSYFTDIDILVFDTGGTVTDCTTSCARGFYRNMSTGRPSWAEKKLTILMDGAAGTPYNPQDRMMHELGHIADFVSGPNQGLRRDTGTTRDGVQGWNYTSVEYRPTALTEGLATFYATTALYTVNSAWARDCFVNGNSFDKRHCFDSGMTGAVDIEAGIYGSCSGTVGRQEINALRYFWDAWDANVDSIDNVGPLYIYNFLDTVGAWPCSTYPACYGAGALHDPYSSISTDLSTYTVNPSDIDAANGWDFRQTMLNSYSGHIDIQNAYFNNCMGWY